MEKVQITAKISENKEKGVKAQTATINVPFAANHKEALAIYGPEAVFSNAKANAIIGLQSFIRGRLRAGVKVADIESSLKDWKMGVSQRKSADPVASTLKKAENMSKEQLDDLIAKLKGKLG